MQILIHGLNYSPEPIGIGKYTGELSTHLAKEGLQVAVVTAPPYYPDWKIGDGFRAAEYRRERDGEVHVTRCPLWVPKKVTGLKRIIHLASFGLSSLPIVLWKARHRPEVILAIQPTLFSLPPALLAARLCGAKAWLHVQDFEVDAAFELGILKSNWIKRLVTGLESFLMRRFDRVSSISPKMVERLIDKGVSKDRVCLFPNWVDCETIRPLPNGKELRESFGLPTDALIVLYSGNFGEKQGLEIIINAAKEFRDRRDVVFVMCGNGAAHQRLLRMADGLTNIRWMPLQPLSRFNDLLNSADIHLLPQRSDAADLVMPSKLTGILASGKPVVACAKFGTQIASVVEGRGIVVEPEATDKFIHAIEELANNAELRERYGRAGREYAVSHLSIESIIARFLCDLKEMTGKQTPSA